MVTEFIDSSYRLVLREHFETHDDFDKMLNWMRDDFTFYQQECNDGLKVFFPNGWFEINLIETPSVEYEISVNSKCNKSLVKTYNKILSVVNHFKKYKKSFLKEDIICN